jgi:hypothetical protein
VFEGVGSQGRQESWEGERKRPGATFWYKRNQEAVAVTSHARRRRGEGFCSKSGLQNLRIVLDGL